MGYLRFVAANPRFLAFGFALAFFSSFGQTYFISLFGEEIRDAFALSHGRFGLLYSIATLASGLTIIWIGQKIDSVDLRPFSVAVCLGIVIACLGMSAVANVVMLVLALYLLRLTGQGLLSHTAMTSMARYFDDERGKAMSVAGLGFPAGEAVLPIIAVSVMGAIGWRQTWLGLGALLAVVVIPLALVLLRGHAARHRRYLEHLAHTESRAVADLHLISRQWTRAEVLRDPRFYLILPAVTAPAFIVTGLFFHQVHLVEMKGWRMEWFAACFAAFAGAQLPAGILAGPLVDRTGAARLLPAFCLPLAVGLMILALGRHPLTALGFMIFAGLTSGLGSPVVGSMWAEIYGVRHLGAIRAMVTAIMVFATAGSPVSMGWLIDEGVTMETIAWLCFAYAIIGSALAWVALRPARSQHS